VKNEARELSVLEDVGFAAPGEQAPVLRVEDRGERVAVTDAPAKIGCLGGRAATGGHLRGKQQAERKKTNAHHCSLLLPAHSLARAGFPGVCTVAGSTPSGPERFSDPERVGAWILGVLIGHRWRHFAEIGTGGNTATAALTAV